MGRRCQRKPDCRGEVLLFQLAQIAEFDCRPQSNAAFIYHREEVWDKLCEANVAIDLIAAVSNCLRQNFI